MLADLEPYVVPSPGDWSVHRGGAVMIEGAEGTTIEQCEFVRLGGNAVALSGHAWHTTIADSEFFKIGDSAIVTVGDFKQNDGVVSSPQQLPSLPLLVQDPWQHPHCVRCDPWIQSSDKYPLETSITGNHFHEIGVTVSRAIIAGIWVAFWPEIPAMIVRTGQADERSLLRHLLPHHLPRQRGVQRPPCRGARDPSHGHAVRSSLTP